MTKFSEYLKNIFFFLVVLQLAPPMIKTIKKEYFSFLDTNTQIAWVEIAGELHNSATPIKNLKKFFKDDEIKAIVLKIESPGSAAGTAECIANEIAALKKEFPKPIITLSENICASGSYYIAAATDYIIGAPSTLFGSIGTQIPLNFKFNEFIAKHNVGYETIKAGDFKNMLNPFVATTPEQKALLEGVAKDSYENFIEHVLKYRRNLEKNKQNEWANGKIFTGRQALKIGLIDEVGSLANAEEKIKQLVIVDGSIEWVKPAKKTGLLAMLTGSEGPQLKTISSSLAESFLNIFINNRTSSLPS